MLPSAVVAIPLRKRIRRSVRSWLIRVAFRLLSALPLGAALRLGAAAGDVAWRLSARNRRLALQHLALAFPEATEPVRRAIGRESFRNLGRAALELVAIRRYDARLEAYVAIPPDDERLMHDVMARGRGMIFVTGHVGSWELLARRIARAGVENAVIAKATWDPKLNALVERFRAGGGVATLWREDPATGRAMIRTLRQGKALGILIDQDTKVQGVFVPFFGRPAYTPRAAGDLALRFGAPVVVGSCRRRGTGPGDGHVLEFREVPFDPDPPDREAEALRITAACSSLLESAIRRNPSEWVWMHERWRTIPGSEPALARGMPKSRELSGS